jgi:hypothetical protein
VGYECLWLQGDLEEDERPDKVGVLFNEAQIRGGGSMLVGRVVSDDSILLDSTSAAAHMISRLTRKEEKVVSISRVNGSATMLGKPDVVRSLILRAKDLAVKERANAHGI